jgi:hypothetical protein
MKLAAIGFAMLSLAVAGTASAAGRVSDTDYLRANRCKGLAVGLGSSETAGLDAFLKAEGRWREPIVLSQGDYEMHRAQREAKDANMKDKLSAELAGPCTAYRSTGASTPTAR